MSTMTSDKSVVESTSIDAETTTERSAGGSNSVMSLVRSLSILSAFTPQDEWLGNRELVIETRIPAPTVSRMLRSLVALGYLYYSRDRRKYRLAAPVLSLGYAAIAHSNLQRVAHHEIQKLADASDGVIVLGTRDSLDVIVLERRTGKQSVIDLPMHAGTRLRIASSPLGWALPAALPELERFYLLGNIERRNDGDWPKLRRSISEGISQARNLGYCASIGKWEPELAVVATALSVPDQAPLVLAWVGSSTRAGRMRVDRELGPRLAAAAQAMQERALLEHRSNHEK